MIKNMFADIPNDLKEEVFETLLDSPDLKLERIISRAHRTPEGQWYDQERNEWVILLQGSAGLLFTDEEQPHTLMPGDYVLIPAHKKHRVEWTNATTETIWLALHF